MVPKTNINTDREVGPPTGAQPRIYKGRQPGDIRTDPTEVPQRTPGVEGSGQSS